MAGEKRRRTSTSTKTRVLAATSEPSTVSSCSLEVPISASTSASGSPPASPPLTAVPLSVLNPDEESEDDLPWPPVESIWKPITKSIEEMMGFEFRHVDDSTEADHGRVSETQYEEMNNWFESIKKTQMLMKHEIFQKTVAIHQVYRCLVDTEDKLQKAEKEAAKAKEDAAKYREEAAKAGEEKEAEADMQKKLKAELAEKDAIINMLRGLKDPQGDFQRLRDKYKQLKRKVKPTF